jgi:hypothetical protein
MRRRAKVGRFEMQKSRRWRDGAGLARKPIETKRDNQDMSPLHRAAMMEAFNG